MDNNVNRRMAYNHYFVKRAAAPAPGTERDTSNPKTHHARNGHGVFFFVRVDRLCP